MAPLPWEVDSPTRFPYSRRSGLVFLQGTEDGTHVSVAVFRVTPYVTRYSLAAGRAENAETQDKGDPWIRFCSFSSSLAQLGFTSSLMTTGLVALFLPPVIFICQSRTGRKVLDRDVQGAGALSVLRTGTVVRACPTQPLR